MVEGVGGLDVGAQDVEAGAHHVLELREPVEAVAVAFGEHADGNAVVDHDHRTVGPLVDQRQCVGDRGIGTERDRCLEDGVATLDVVDHPTHHVDGDVLRQDRDATASRHGLGHPPTGHGRHVRHDERDRGADAVRGPQVDAHPRRHIRQARHHEHVAVGQIEAGFGVKHAHGFLLVSEHGWARNTRLTSEHRLGPSLARP
jgi:hypothetical protein